MSSEAKFHYTVLAAICGLVFLVCIYFFRQNEDRRQKLFHVMLGILSAATFLLIFVGAMVASTRSGMAFMDWPTSNGLIWPSLDKWIHQKDMFWEHFHRLIAEGVGVLAITLLIWSFKVYGKKYWKACLILLIAIIVQGIFGGLTVGKLTAWWTSTLHGIVAQVVFAFMVILYFKTSRSVEQHKAIEDNDSWLRSLPKAVCIIILIQLFLGASFRHKMKVAQFSSEVPAETVSFQFSKPGTYTLKAKPSESGVCKIELISDQALETQKIIEQDFTGELINLATFEVQDKLDYSLKFNLKVSEVSLVGPERLVSNGDVLPFSVVYEEVLEGNQHLLWAHIGFAIVVFIVVLMMALYLLKKGEDFALIKTTSIILIVSLAVQITLGVFAYLTVHERQNQVYDQLKTILTSAHLANGALLLAFAAVALYFCRTGFVKTAKGE